jgi:hypothetical protein
LNQEYKIKLKKVSFLSKMCKTGRKGKPVTGNTEAGDEKYGDWRKGGREPEGVRAL